jgi:thiol-disulfide isomerase/thioredoxin
MTKERKIIILLSIIVLVATYLGISSFTRSKLNTEKQQKLEAETRIRTEEKAKIYKIAPEISSANGYINTEKVDLGSLRGKKVVLLDFWTSMSSNSQKTISHLNAWYEKYKNEGLMVIGVHTPEFSFEKDKSRLESIIKELDIKYPIVLDDNYKTWGRYANDAWPKLYLIDIDGFVVYNHIGEGAYDITEKNIQELLDEKSELAGQPKKIVGSVKLEESNNEVVEFPGSPYIYFGYGRNTLLDNGITSIPGVQILKKPSKIDLNKLYLIGKWNFEREYTESMSADAKIVFKYNAKEVYLVAGSASTTLSISQDGKPLNGLEVLDENLYKLVKNDVAGEHTLEIIVGNPGLKAYVVEFR